MKKTLIILISIILIFSLFRVTQASLRMNVGHMSREGNIIKISQGVVIQKDDIELSGERGSFNQQDEKIDLEENIKMVFDRGEITSGNMTGNLQEEKYIFKDQVIFVQKQEGEEADEMKLYSPYLKLNQADQTFFARDGVEIDYNEAFLKADEVHYCQDQEILELFNNVYIEEADGTWIRGGKATFYLDSEEEEFTVEDQVEIEFEP